MEAVATKKRTKTQTTKGISLPEGEKVARDTGEVTPLAADDVALVVRGWELKRQIEELEAQLKQINAQLIEAHGAGVSLVVPGVCRVSIAEREAVRVVDAERLRAVLGGRFDDLVRVEVAYKVEPRLVEMACDADEPLSPAIRACLSVGRSASVTWRAEK